MKLFKRPFGHYEMAAFLQSRPRRFHIACDAANDAAVQRLRMNKREEQQALAVMAPDVEAVEVFA
jgi:hypothetical protein